MGCGVAWGGVFRGGIAEYEIKVTGLRKQTLLSLSSVSSVYMWTACILRTPNRIVHG